ncbi:MAG: MBL fold metallo-hydrolase [Clostridiales bacterium]|nr:MBL fold metallo-hydrolase [Clostridiales bacterium]
MIIKVHRGTHQIGGCITEIKSDNARIFIDMGAELPGLEVSGNSPIDGVTTGFPSCDAVFITHYHGDHIGLYGKVLPGIPIYMGEAAKEMFMLLAARVNDEHKERIKDFKTFNALDKITINDITVTPLLVDHSAFDAYMFLIECGGKRILHTGDFRLHGFRGKAVIPTLKKYVGAVDVLITEGTLLSRESKTHLDEGEIKMLAKLILARDKYVFVLCSSTNIDRIVAFYHATPRGKYFLCDDYQKEMLDVVTKHAGDKTSLYNFQKALTYGKNLDEKLHERGFCMLVRAGEYFKKIMDKFPDAVFLFSMWEGYIKGKNKNNKLSEFTSGYDFEPFHTSGHATKTAIKLVCETVKPSIGIIPIHSAAPRNIANLHMGYNVIYLNDNEEFSPDR